MSQQNNLNDAYAFTVGIPALKAVFDPNDESFLRSLLMVTAAKKDDKPFYRCWITAAAYLEQSPAIHRVTKHDRTTLGDYAKPIAWLKLQQVAEDSQNGLVTDEEAIATMKNWTIAYRPVIEF